MDAILLHSEVTIIILHCSPHFFERGILFRSPHLIRWLIIFKDRVCLGKETKLIEQALGP